MKSFQKFLEEASVKGNSGIPGQGEKQTGENDYLRDVENRAKTRLGLDNRTNPNQIGGRMMQLLDQSMRFVRGKESELADLATKIIMHHYEAILDGVELDIKIVKPGKVKDFMDEESEPEAPPPQRQIKDKDTIKEIEKRKIANNVMQGEAKNTKQILHTEEVMDGLIEIYGEQKAREVHTIWDELTKLADKMDWIIPIEIKGKMMEDAPEGMAGAVRVEWKPKEKNEEDEDEDDTDKLLRSAMNDEDEEDEEFSAESTPVIRARGVDFPMLLHETVKGIYELIAASGIPENPEIAKKVISNTSSFEDEAEEFKYGPEIAADLRDFINENNRVDDYPNVREFVFGEMIKMPADQFLSLMRGILSKTPLARRKIDGIINDIVDTVKRQAREVDEFDNYSKSDEEDEYSDTLEPGRNEKPDPKVVKPNDDYSTWSQSELQSEIDDALDNGDYDKVKKLSNFLKEGKLYLRELRVLNEKKNLHTK
jgi:hypothetical protein